LSCATGCTRDSAAHLSAVSSPSPLPIATGDYPQAGSAADFSWIAGTLQSSLGCRFVIFQDARRAPWGGRLPLVDWYDITRDLPDGDAVVLKGALYPLGAGRCGSPAYLVRTVEEH